MRGLAGTIKGLARLGTLNFLDGENWPITPSDVDHALMASLRLLLRVDGNVEELSSGITLALKRS